MINPRYTFMALSMNSLNSLLWVALLPVAGDGAVPRPMYLRSLESDVEKWLINYNW